MKHLPTIAAVSVLLLPMLIWLHSHFESLLGAWSLPLGIAQLWLACFCLFLSLLFHIVSKKQFLWMFFGLLNLFILMEDFRLYTGSSEGIPIFSWNLNAPQKKEMDCIVPKMKKWVENNPDGLVFLQEVSERNYKRLMSNTTLKCMGASYHPIESCRNRKKETCPGLAICASKKWSFRRAHHKTFPDQRKYGYFQTELKAPGQENYFNALNLHLESLWRTRYELKTKSLYTLLHENTLRQRDQLLKVEKVMSLLKDPTLLVGDFNSVSSMWLHRRLRKNLRDSHRARGYSFGMSATRYSIPIRVDHMYIQKPMFWSGKTKVLKEYTCSDHLPISSWFSMEKHSASSSQ